jgi:hypothetical protein
MYRAVTNIMSLIVSSHPRHDILHDVGMAYH